MKYVYTCETWQEKRGIFVEVIDKTNLIILNQIPTYMGEDIDLMKAFEGFKSIMYDDSVPYCHGYGGTPTTIGEVARGKVQVTKKDFYKVIGLRYNPISPHKGSILKFNFLR